MSYSIVVLVQVKWGEVFRTAGLTVGELHGKGVRPKAFVWRIHP